MKRILFIFILIAVALSCKKDESNVEVQQFEQEIRFDITLIDPAADMKEWECKPLEPDYAQVTIMIEGTPIDFFPEVYRIDGMLYTQSIKLILPAGVSTMNYSVTNFLLWDDGSTPGGTLPEGDDEIVMGIPLSGSDYAIYVTQPVPFDITITAFEKHQIPVEVLCFLEDVYMKFGFDWFIVTEIVIREQCLFGDFCVKHPDDYLSSYYENQSTGLQLDMPAIFEIHAYKDGVELTNSPFTNATAEANWGVGAPLCVEYPDNLNVDGEVFTFELWIYVKKGSVFVFKHFHTWTFVDDGIIAEGDDGIVEFVLGSCNYTGTDLQLAPYQNLPDMVYMQISYPGDPGYWNLKIHSTTPTGTYDMAIGVWLTAWCGDAYHQIPPGYHDVYVHTSLYDHEWPMGMPFDMATIAKVNWIMNRLNNYGMDIDNLSNAEGDIIQDAIWNLINSIPCSGIALDMVNDATLYGDGYVPPPGGWAAVLFIKDDMPMFYQLIFVMVDP